MSLTEGSDRAPVLSLWFSPQVHIGISSPIYSPQSPFTTVFCLLPISYLLSLLMESAGLVHSMMEIDGEE